MLKKSADETVHLHLQLGPTSSLDPRTDVWLLLSRHLNVEGSDPYLAMHAVEDVANSHASLAEIRTSAVSPKCCLAILLDNAPQTYFDSPHILVRTT